MATKDKGVLGRSISLEPRVTVRFAGKIELSEVDVQINYWLHRGCSTPSLAYLTRPGTFRAALAAALVRASAAFFSAAAARARIIFAFARAAALCTFVVLVAATLPSVGLGVAVAVTAVETPAVAELDGGIDGALAGAVFIGVDV